jgi:hypothetical protein
MVRSGLAALLAVAVLAFTGYAGWTYVTTRDQRFCSACRRPVHAASVTHARVDGREAVFCCPACALSERRQSSQRVEILSLTEFTSGATLSPRDAFLVRGSDAHTCGHGEYARGEYDRPVQVSFDRCSPSLLAFASRARAAQFSREHGGQVLPFGEFAARYP